MGILADTEIAGKLRLVSLLGQGASGQVWLARHLGLGSEVAVKFLNRDVSAVPTSRERFVREARTVARLRSPHVVQVHDFGFHEGHAYLVMEYLVGETLEARLERAGALPAEQVVRVCTQIAKALQRAHDAGIIHRDIKPANVFLVDYGDEEIAKVVDFGIVKAKDSSLAEGTMETLTRTGSLLGTPYYMSPEQIQDSGTVGPQADLWALGVIAFECLVGQLPFSAPNFPRLVMAICRDPVPVPSAITDVPSAFDAWVARALERDPAKRFSSAKELARELCRALIFNELGECLSMPDGVVPPDLLWSGAYPAALTSRSGHDALSDSTPPRPSSDHPSHPGPAKPVSDRPRPGIPDAVLRSALLPVAQSNIDSAVSQDGSLGSQVSTRRPPASPPAPSRVSRIVLIAAGSLVLLAVGWFANRFTLVDRNASTPPSSEVAAPVVTLPAASSVVSPRPSAATGVAASSSAPALSSSAPPPEDVSSRRFATPTAVKTPSPAPAPVDTSAPAAAETAAPKRVDPLEERQ